MTKSQIHPGNLTQLRTAIAAGKAEMQGLRPDRYRDQSDALADIAAVVAHDAHPINARIQYATVSGEMVDLLVVQPRPDGAIDLGPMLAAILGPDVLAAALSRYVNELPPAGGKANRAARLAEIAARLDELEKAEEVEICRLEMQGLTVDRRADARPEIVLAIR